MCRLASKAIRGKTVEWVGWGAPKVQYPWAFGDFNGGPDRSPCVSALKLYETPQVFDFSSVVVSGGNLKEYASGGAGRRIKAHKIPSYPWNIRGATKTVSQAKPQLIMSQSSRHINDRSAGLGARLAQLYSKITVQKKRGSYGALK